jgi:hypothetical protein
MARDDARAADLYRQACDGGEAKGCCTACASCPSAVRWWSV